MQNKETGGGGRPMPPPMPFQITGPLLELKTLLGIQITGLQSDCDNDNDEDVSSTNNIRFVRLFLFENSVERKFHSITFAEFVSINIK